MTLGRVWSGKRDLSQKVEPFLAPEMLWWSSKADGETDVQQTIVSVGCLSAANEQRRHAMHVSETAPE